MKSILHFSLTVLICGFLTGQLTAAEAELSLPIKPGPFQPTMESLTNYHCPDWFRDAKFGIWAHWGPQAVPMDGDWYARQMYQQGHAQYKDHLEHYGHPSTNGYKDIIPLWKAEKWDPDRLMALYKRAGAKYFVSMGSHHDNFFLWNSKLHRWNAVNMGPHRDVVGTWQKAARKNGLKFGVSEHLGASFTWFQDSHKSDKTGPLAGVPYDGADPQYEDLYHFPAQPGDTGWYSTNPRWQQMWFNEIKELVDNYHPDLLYTDGGVPFGNDVGRSMIAHLYNSDAGRHGGKPQVIYTCKQKSEGRWVEDLERGVMPGINPYPWQTDTSIGDWFYNRNWKFRPVSWTIHMLVDIVSKNGNLLLNVVQRPDGSLDAEVEQSLNELADWIKIHGEAIYGTRPWLVYGEGAVRTKGGHFHEDFKYTAQDIRFTTKGRALYAIALGWPEDGKLVIKSLASTGAGKIKRVSLLGSKAKLTWTRIPEGLVVNLPAEKLSPHTCGLRIEGTDLKPAPLVEETAIIEPDAKGELTLPADAAEIHGDKLNTEDRDGQMNLGFWDNPREWASWRVRLSKAGKFNVSASIATVNDGSELALEAGANLVSKKIEATGDWGTFKIFDLGTIDLPQGGQVISVRPKDASSWKALNLRSIRLKSAADY
ncbi:MAG TPA: alpha-L-fucosidase [Verrucomicrobiae bacterium]|nr:alpha-L-fucosidase [Verrucomicrobiae bacterium]